MAKIKLTGGYKILEEGTYKFRIASAEYKEQFGKLNFILETEKGDKVSNSYNFGADGSNQKSMNAFSFFARQVLNNGFADEVDPDDLVGKWVIGDVVHTKSDDGEKTFVNLKNWKAVDTDEEDVPFAPAEEPKKDWRSLLDD